VFGAHGPDLRRKRRKQEARSRLNGDMTNTSHDARNTIRCARCERDDVAAIGLAPFPNELGQRISGEVCEECWEAWKHHQMLLINHYGLNLQDSNARTFLITNLKSFLFAEGPAGASIDTSKEGDVSW
jgi:Fe-S cluster biosynthesis and repair protein YggX